MMKSNFVDKKIVASEDKVRQSLHDLQPSAKGKENLVGAGRILRSGRQSAEAKIESDAPKKKSDFPRSKTTYKDKSVQTARGEKTKIEVEDLTSAAGPSENYWEVIAEKRRLALEDVLEENKQLSEWNKELESKLKEKSEELNTYKEMLNETRALVEVLQDMVEDDSNGINNSLDDSAL